MRDGPRLLVAAALGRVIEPFLRQSMSDATVRIAEDKAAGSGRSAIACGSTW